MAMFESKGFCPRNSFNRLLQDAEVSPLWDRTREVLGDRIEYLVYTEHGYTTNQVCEVVDCLMYGSSTIGLEIATYLTALIPQCEYSKSGKMILVTDVINPGQIPHLLWNLNGFSSEDEKLLRVFEDDRYVCGIATEGDAVHLYFYKK